MREERSTEDCDRREDQRRSGVARSEATLLRGQRLLFDSF